MGQALPFKIPKGLLLFCRLFSFNPNIDFNRSLSGPYRKKLAKETLKAQKIPTQTGDRLSRFFRGSG